ncbi:hypothetical protein [Vibrio parahaemolyticus]|uniref:hypothetical protein n=1 Tax=Vibrio parahaemolyticus TaxID=670 RepID=UPI00111D00B1|nr:hypothetical protein [Vibrio parahaemolyticus]TOP86890.1 hypothetical protein CGH06_23830 [Vibrio parahaemolyticus]
MKILKKSQYEPQHWKTFKMLEPDTGVFLCRYTYKRKPAHRVVVDTPKATTLSGYLLIEKDLRNTLIWLNQIKSTLEQHDATKNQTGHIATGDRSIFDTVKGLFVAALTFYGKCFSTCEGRRIKLDKKIIDEKYVDTHSYLIEMRNNFAAHSGATKVEVARVVLALDKNKKKNTFPHLAKEVFQPDTSSLQEIYKFIESVEWLHKYVDDKIDTLVEKIMEDDILKEGLEAWYAKAT